MGTAGAASSGSLSWAVGGWHGSCKCRPHAGTLQSTVHSPLSLSSLLSSQSTSLLPCRPWRSLTASRPAGPPPSTIPPPRPAALKGYTTISEALHPPPKSLAHLPSRNLLPHRPQRSTHHLESHWPASKNNLPAPPPESPFNVHPPPRTSLQGPTTPVLCQQGPALAAGAQGAPMHPHPPLPLPLSLPLLLPLLNPSRTCASCRRCDDGRVAAAALALQLAAHLAALLRPFPAPWQGVPPRAVMMHLPLGQIHPWQIPRLTQIPHRNQIPNPELYPQPSLCLAGHSAQRLLLLLCGCLSGFRGLTPASP